jgi:hypothetical protein
VLHLPGADLFANVGGKLQEDSVPGASSSTATAAVGVKHPFHPGNAGVTFSGYDNVAAHVNGNDPNNFDPNYKNVQAAIFADAPLEFPWGVEGKGYVELGLRDGDDSVKRVNSVVQLSAEKQVGPMKVLGEVAGIYGAWTHVPREDVIVSGKVSGSVPVAKGLNLVGGVNARARNSNLPGKDILDVGVFGGIQGDLSFSSSKTKPKR